MVNGQASSRLPFLKIVLVSTLVGCGVLGADPNVVIGIPVTYDASAFLSVSAAPGLLPFGSSLTLFPGVAFTPPPFAKFVASATNSATANVPGQVRAAASGAALGSECPLIFCGEQNTESFAASSANAIGFGSLLKRTGLDFPPRPPDFPLLMHEVWSVSASSEMAQAKVNLTALLNGVVIFEDSGSAGGATGVRFASKDATVPLTVALEPGFNSLVFMVEADGLAATPEPATLLLVGTTAAGLGLARWRQRRRKQAARTP